MAVGDLRVHHRGMAPTSAVHADHDRSGARALRRSASQRLACGVAGGLADYLDVDVVLVRVAFVALAIAGGFALPLYLAAWLLVPDEGSDQSIGERLVGRVLGDDDEGWRGDGTRR